VSTQLVHPDARLVDGATGATLAGGALQRRLDEVAAAAQAWPTGIALLLAPLTVDAAVTFAGLVTAGRPVALLDPATPPAALAGLIERYQPAAVLGAEAQPAGYRAAVADICVRDGGDMPAPHPDLAVLLPTSGSTGNPKLVRLSRSNILANADSIATALSIDGDETAPTSLPFFYSYGMSVLNSHLIRGARVVVTGDGLISREFWATVDREKATSLAAVPYQYTMLKRLRFDPARYSSITAITQAGGRLSTDLVSDFNSRMAAVGGRMYVMYGQTEASPRMTTLPPDRLRDKLGSAGVAIPGGRLSVLDGEVETDQPNVTGEIVYRGPNVMMGYADGVADLPLGDLQSGALRTGDLGYVDDEGFLFITGRLKRIGKAFGVRVNLDDIENLLKGHGAVAAVPGDEKVVVFAERADSERRQAMARLLGDSLKLHPSGFDVRDIDALPLLGNGKIDYRSLEAQR
jgi:acyl-CoA synthetase (AMP-forming)/AMP-acid ligase II